MNTSTHSRYTPKQSIEGPVQHEIIENVKDFHEAQIQPLKKKGAEEFGEYCGRSQFYTLLMVFCLF